MPQGATQETRTSVYARIVADPGVTRATRARDSGVCFATTRDDARDPDLSPRLPDGTSGAPRAAVAGAARGVALGAARRGRARDPPARRPLRRARRVVLRAEGAALAARVARVPPPDRAPARGDAGRGADRRRRRPARAGGRRARGRP